MNDEIYAEWYVERKNPVWFIPAILGMGVLVLIGFWLMITQATWGFIPFLVIILGIVYGYRFLHVDYEYIFVSNELRIDRVFSQSVRKKGITIQMTDVEVVEKTNEERNKALLADKNAVHEDFSSLKKDAETYTMIYTAKGKRHVMVFEPNEKLLRAMWRCSPSKVRIPR